MKAKAINVSFLPQTEKIIRDVDEQMALHNFSAALRYIVHDWARGRRITDAPGDSPPSVPSQPPPQAGAVQAPPQSPPQAGGRGSATPTITDGEGER